MMMRVLLVAAVVAASTVCALAAHKATLHKAAAPSASDGWQFAKWGMTPDKVRMASHSTVMAGEDGGYDTMGHKYSMGKFKFDANFDYMPRPEDPGNEAPENQMLDAVILNLDMSSGSCADLERYLKKRYGRPTQTFSSGPAGDRWRSKKVGDVNYSTWDDKKCDVMYQAYGTSDQ